jgi:hypothetical protein
MVFQKLYISLAYKANHILTTPYRFHCLFFETLEYNNKNIESEVNEAVNEFASSGYCQFIYS